MVLLFVCAAQANVYQEYTCYEYDQQSSCIFLVSK